MAEEKKQARSLYSIVEQEERFAALRSVIGADMAIYVLCAYCDVPYKPDVPATSWEQYLKKAPRKSMERFADGETDAFRAINMGVADADRWAKIWGVGEDGCHYSKNDYKRLDQIFANYTERLNRSGGYDVQQEDTTYIRGERSAFKI